MGNQKKNKTGSGFEPECEFATFFPLQDDLSLQIGWTGHKCPPKSKLNGRMLANASQDG